MSTSWPKKTRSDDLPPRRGGNRSSVFGRKTGNSFMAHKTGNSFMAHSKINKVLPSPVKAHVQLLCKKNSGIYRLKEKNNTASWNKCFILDSDRVQPFSNFPSLFTPKGKQWFQEPPSPLYI